MPFNIVLIHPEIPQNTGNIGRLCLGTGSVLHLVDPLGFELTDKHLLRAGLDYWPHLQWQRYASPEHFFSSHKGGNFVLFSSKAKTCYWDHRFTEGDFLIFGPEARGLPAELLQKYPALNIPMYDDRVRSYNLANSVAIALFESLRQTQHEK